MRILAIDRDNAVLSVREKLQIIGQIDFAESLKDGEYFLMARNYGLIIMDYSSAPLAQTIIREAKNKASGVIVIAISDSPAVETEVAALRAGADEFIRKPFDAEVFMARVEARLRTGYSPIIEAGPLLINPEEEKVTYKDQVLDLKGKPFEVLAHLARNMGTIVSKEQLLDAIWEEPELVTPNVIEVAINQIRQKVDKPLGIATVETIRRRGYRFVGAV